MWPFSSSPGKNLSLQEKWDAKRYSAEEIHADFFKAIKREKLQDIEKIIVAHPEAMNWKTSKGQSALHYAMFEGCLESFKYLLEKGAPQGIEYECSYVTDSSYRRLDVFNAACYRRKKDFVFAYLERNSVYYGSLKEAAHKEGVKSPDIRSYLENAAQIYRDYQEEQKLKSALMREEKAEHKQENKKAELNAEKNHFSQQ